ncbi:FimB/Mfa2 family fimbrial subunit [Gabonibacter chumensis]|uniref:FimB/Mfa2 family fimbrial subunit n=1 Tax=Gabonibacter chumensis TaxID=2972474 RepID=UPI002573C832|nr:FimB/Mfa2 family fimbrial subunit [Gabonibacter chumensis]MCR9011214.1 FimB/Mfa2 family fimbrial subunit [Gabonibacter chumensis]
MKKWYFMTLASILMLACSKNESEGPRDISQGNIVFELATVNQSENGIKAKTRPLYSQEAVQEVERVFIYAFKNNGTNYVYDTTYTTAWPKGTTFMRYFVANNNKLEAGDYQFLVVGRELTDNFTLTTPVIGTTQITDMTATIPSVGKESEIFAGEKNVSVTSEGVRVSVEMTRKIAGILGYFINVPAVIGNVNVATLRLTITNASTQLNLYSGLGSSPTGTSFNVFNIDLTGQAVTSAGVFAGNDLTGQGVVKLDNTQLMGRFFIPTSNISMTLGLYDAAGNALKTWSVVNESSTTFDLLPNHFYTLGKKVTKGDTTGGGTPDKGDDDAPIDLLKDQVIAITINPNWSQFHNLVIQN